MTTNKLIILSVFVLLTTSCAIAPTVPKSESYGAIRTISDTSDTQITVIKEHGAPVRYCAARPGDVADTRSVGGSLGFGVALGGNDSIGDGSNQGALALGGRNPAVLITREMMYRACELSLNLNADNAQTMEIYKLFIEKTKEITAIQTSSGSAALGQSASNSNSNQATSTTTSSNSGSSSNTSSASDVVEAQGVD